MLRTIWYGIRAIGNFLQSFILLIIRLYWGYQFIITGYGKLSNLDPIIAYFQSLGIPLPSFFAGLTGCVELIGGFLIFIGLFARIASIPLLCVTFTAYFTAEYFTLVALGAGNTQPFFGATPFLFTYAAILIFCFGPGKISLDYLFTDARKTKDMP